MGSPRAGSPPPVVDLSSAAHHPDDVARQLDEAARATGAFSIVGHGVETELVTALHDAAARVFALDRLDKEAIAMRHGGAAWRGWFPLGDESTAGLPDLKEGLYFGVDHDPLDPLVVAGTPLHGRNLYPAAVPELRRVVPAYIDAMERLGQRVLALLGRALGLGENWFASGVAAEPTMLLRVFRYPALQRRGDAPRPDAPLWGVGEHTDYGLLTILWQDPAGGLEIHTPDGWVDVAPVDGAFVCNLGDMLERLTGGAYRSTPHRVRPPSNVDRISIPAFVDPGWDERVPIAVTGESVRHRIRWDGREPLDWDGTYGEYLTQKVAGAFPHLFADIAGRGRSDGASHDDIAPHG